MTAISKYDYDKKLYEQENEVRNMVKEGLAQIKEGKTKDFDAVCERLEKKYIEEIQD